MRRTTIYVIGVLALLGATLPSASASPSPQHYQVGTTADDAWQRGVPSPDEYPTYYTDQSLFISWGPEVTDVMNVGIRIENVQLSQGETVPTTTLNLYNQFGYKFEGDIYAELTPNSVDFSVNNSILSRTRTVSPVPWDYNHARNNTVIHTPDLSPIVQEVVNQPTWHKGNSITFLIIGELDPTYIYAVPSSLADYSSGSHAATLDIFG